VVKVVLDTNTIISGLLNPNGPPGRILNLAAQNEITLATSDHLIEELSRAMQYEKVVNILTRRGWTKQDTAVFIEKLRKICKLTPGNPLLENVCRDPDDDWFLACAKEAEADVMVSGDKDLLTLEKYEEIRIIDARSFLNEYIATNT